MDGMVLAQAQRRRDALHCIGIVRVAGTGTSCGEGYYTLGEYEGRAKDVRIPCALCPSDI